MAWRGLASSCVSDSLGGRREGMAQLLADYERAWSSPLQITILLEL